MAFDFQTYDTAYFEAWPPVKCYEKELTFEPNHQQISAQQSSYKEHLSMSKRK